MGRFSHVFRIESAQNSGLDVLEKVLLLTLNHRVEVLRSTTDSIAVSIKAVDIAADYFYGCEAEFLDISAV